MLIPTYANYTSNFYAVGNTPALSLTRALPQGQDADILLLGCGDVRNVLFTAYVEDGLPTRKLDITCCDIDENVLARNILLFTLLIDKTAEAPSLWNIYYHFYLDAPDLDLLSSQLTKLIPLTETETTWKSGKYGKKIIFCDAGTRKKVAAVWRAHLAIAKARDAPSTLRDFKASIARTLDMMETLRGKGGMTLTGLRSAAPCAILTSKAPEELPKEYLEYWEKGTVGVVGAGTSFANPMFAGSVSDHVLLHYGLDPILGFHLAAAYTPLAKASPLTHVSTGKEKFKAVSAAKTQFKAWSASFRSLAKNVTLRFAASEALSLLHTLQHFLATSALTANLFVRQFRAETLILSEEHGSSAPKAFDMIDTSNLTDHIGALNILIGAAPLLKVVPWATLSTELLLNTGGSGKEVLSKLLCGDGSTISLLLGVSPMEYWTNTTAVSSIDEIMLGMMQKSTSDPGSGEQTHIRLSWKRNAHFSGKTEPRVRIEPKAVAKILHSMHVQMFQHNGLGLSGVTNLAATRLNTYSPFHRGSLSTILKTVSMRVEFDVNTMREELDTLTALVAKDPVTLFGLHLNELALQMHLQGVTTTEWLHLIDSDPGLGTVHAWKNIPLVTAVTLVIPRSKFNRLYEGLNSSKIHTPRLQGFLRSGPGAKSQFLNVYADMHLAFGALRTSGPRDKDTFRVAVDPSGCAAWPDDDTPVTAMFYVPTQALQVEPKNTKVGLSVNLGMKSIEIYRRTLGDELVVHDADLHDEESVYLTKYLPGQTGYPLVCGAAKLEGKPAEKDETFTTKFTADVDADRITTVTARVDILSTRGKALLAAKVSIELQQVSPSVVNLVFGNETLVIPLHYPMPTSADDAKLRIARKSSYIEVVAPFASPITPGSLSDFVFPTVLSGSGPPATLNIQHMNLDKLPILSLQDKGTIRWLSTLTSLQFSAREKVLRDKAMATHDGMSQAPARINFKESTFMLFMLTAGLQGGDTSLFAINHPQKGGIHMLIFVSALRLDGAAASVVADAAVLVVTKELVDSGKMQTFYDIMSPMQCCTLNVNDEELILWKKVFPALAERCRTWSHRPNCEYRAKDATIPLSLEPKTQLLCGCGEGKLPDKFFPLKNWESLAEHSVRIAISPTYAVPIVEDLVSKEGMPAPGAALPGDRCRVCGKKEGMGVELKKCGRCLTVKYCSGECQKKDWKKHKAECGATSG